MRHALRLSARKPWLLAFTAMSFSACRNAPVTPEANASPAAPPMAPAEAAQSGSDREVPQSLVQIPNLSNFYSPYAFVVDKRARKLTIWQQTNEGLKQIASYPADLGKNSGAKKARGDHRTPEGIYFLQERREGPGLDFKLYGSRAFTTDYPNFFDRREGNTGNGIWLHAVPDEVPLTRGSRGCVVVRDNVIREITSYIRLGRTPLLIRDTINLVPAREQAKATAEVNSWLEHWRASWESKKIDDYISHYSPEFRSMHMNRDQWRQYKQRLADAYKTINIRVSNPVVFVDRDHAIARFIQEYVSDKKSDIGEKFLYLKRENGSYRILGETWYEESSAIARQELSSNQASVGH